MKPTVTSFLLLISITFTRQASAQSFKLPALDAPPESAALFAEGKLSTRMNERDFALSPDGKEIFYTISTPKSSFQTIVYSKRGTNGEWSEPRIASFAGTFSDIEPAFSADGNTLYFSSNRPATGTKPKDFDIWKVTRSGSDWTSPETLGPVVNTDADEFYPSITRSGNLYFTAAYKGGPGREDIYLAAWSNNSYQKPVALDTMVNSKYYEFNAFVSPDEQFILFTSYGRKDDTGGGDLYLASKGPDGKWRPARNMKELNSPQLDYCPFVSPDGKVLFFTSERHQLPVSFPDSRTTIQAIREYYDRPANGTGNIYWMAWKKHQ